jgi:antitoxin component of MazEF toxin-antitoxin module
MPRRKKIDNEALMQMIKDKVPQNEIMKNMGFKTSTQLKVAYANALIESGQVPPLKSNRSQKAINIRVSVNPRGSLIIPKKLVEHLGLRLGANFEAHKILGGGVSLKPTV